MVTTSTSRRVWLIAVVRKAVISMLIGVTLLFLMFISRQQFWGWRLALYGGLGGLTTC